MTEILANIGPILMCIAIGWAIFCLWCSVAVLMIFDEDMEREEREHPWREHGHGSSADPRLR